MDFKYESNRIFLENDEGEMIAEITFPMVGENTVNINHTYVSSVLRGQGIAGKLMQEAVKVIEKNGWKAVADCSYAVTWSEKHPEKKDLFNI